MTPVKGLRFVHPHFRVQKSGTPVAQWPHEIREVTKVTADAVYHRPAGTTGKATHYVTRAWFAAYVTEPAKGEK